MTGDDALYVILDDLLGYTTSSVRELSTKVQYRQCDNPERVTKFAMAYQQLQKSDCAFSGHVDNSFAHFNLHQRAVVKLLTHFVLHCATSGSLLKSRRTKWRVTTSEQSAKICQDHTW